MRCWRKKGREEAGRKQMSNDKVLQSAKETCLNKAIGTTRGKLMRRLIRRAFKLYTDQSPYLIGVYLT